MSGWLSKATGALRREAPEEPQPFESVCECGVRHTGLRRRTQQRLICRSCGVALFVLPRDVYPVPTAPPPKRPKKRKKPKAARPAPPPAMTVGKRVFKQATEGVSQATAKVGRGAADAGVGFGQRIADWGRAFVGFWTPLRLIVLGIIVISAVTAAVTLMSDHSEQAVIELTAANESAREAMAAGDYAAAQQHFARAVTLLDRLERRDDPLAREIRQLHRETQAMRDIVSVPVFEIVAEADAAHESGELSNWLQAAFNTRYRDRWLVVEGPVVPADVALSGGAYAVRIPFGIGPHSRSVTIKVALPELDDLVKGRKPRPVILAGQLQKCELALDGRSWIITLERSTAFLWTNADNYQALGFTFDSPQAEKHNQQLLDGQARLVGLEPATGGE